MEKKMVKIFARDNKKIALRVYEGHFATMHSHITHYFDMTTLKYRLSEALLVAEQLSSRYESSTIIDTIVCMDGTQVIGALMADALSKAGIMSINKHNTIYVMSPEYNSNGQMIFRDNVRMMIKDKNVLVLMASATTGRTLKTCLESIQYYGGTIRAVSAIFSAIDNMAGIDVYSIFRGSDVPNYESYPIGKCPMCAASRKIDALVNSFGYSKI